MKGPPSNKFQHPHTISSFPATLDESNCVRFHGIQEIMLDLEFLNIQIANTQIELCGRI